MDLGYYIRNSFGFFLQLYPCVLLCCLPFTKSEWKIKRRIVIGMMAGLAAGSALIFPYVVWALGMIKMEIVGNVYMAAAVLICVAIFFPLLQIRWYKKVLVICVVLYYALAQYMIVNFALGFVTEGEESELYSISVLALYVITMAILFPLFYRILCYIHRKIFWDWGDKEIRRSLLTVSGLTIVYVAAMCVFSTILYWKGGKENAFIDVFEMVLFLIVGWQFAYLYRLSFWKITKMEQEQKQRQEMEIRNVQYEKISREIEKARRQRHDLRHHMRLLTALLKEEKVQEALEHIAKVYEQNEEIDLEQFCENITLNAILAYYVGMAREEGITCRIQAEMPEDLVDSVDLTIVFGNCLENAIEACRRTKEKYLSVMVGVVSHSIGVQIENSCAAMEDAALEGSEIKIERLTSSKIHGGIGLKSVERILEKYGSGPLHGTYDREKQRVSVQFLWNWKEPKKN